jgi:PilZ domain
MYRGAERRLAPRHKGPKAGVILLEQDALFGCAVRDFSPSGVGLVLPDVVHLPSEFDVTFSHANHHCIVVWRQLDRIGLKFKST